MKKPKLIHLIALLFSLSMLVGILPTSVFAATGSGITAEETRDSDTFDVTESPNAQSENAVIEAPSDTSNTQSEIATVASTGSGSTKYFTIDSTNCHMNWKYNGASGTRVNAAFTVYGTSTDAAKLTLLGDAVFCGQHFNKTPPNKTQCIYVGKLSELESSIKLTDDLTADKAYRIIKAAQAVLQENPKYQNGLTTQQVVFAIQQVFHSSESFLDFFMYGVAGSDYESDSQAKLCGELYKAVYDKFHSSAYYNMTVPSEQPLTATPSGGNVYRSENSYILETYTLNMDGVTAKVSSGTSGVTASVSGRTLTVSIPASKMPTSGNISWNVSLSSANQSLESVNLYTSGVEGKQELILLEEEYYTPTATVPGSVPVSENGSVEVTKVEAGNTSHKLAGAYFLIVDKDRGTVFTLGPTDSSGYAEYTELPIGRYTITESIAPEGYARSNWSADFEIKAGETSNFSYTVENRSKSATWQPYGVTKIFVVPSGSSDSMECTFELLQDGVVIQTKTATVRSGDYSYSSAKVQFDPVQFSEEDNGKSFIFTIREKDGGEPGVWYSKGEIYWNVRIENYAVNLGLPSISGRDIWAMDQNWSSDWWTPYFVNYKPVGSWMPNVTKSFNGSLTDGQFEFVLEEDGVELQRVKNKADGSIPFTAIEYTADDIGQHTYTIREINGGNEDVNYDNHVVTVVVDVNFSGFSFGQSSSFQLPADSDKLTVTESSVSGSTTFVNNVQKKGSWTPTATKQVTGTGAKLTDGQFTFVLYENGEELQRVKNNENGTVPFSVINYTLSDVGTHTYTVKEWLDGQDGWIYDTHTLTYTVSVTEGTSALVVTPTASGSTTFENRYETIKIRVEKVWNDQNNANSLRQDVHFVLYGSNGNMIPFTLPVGQTSYEVTDIPKYNLDGTEITYTLAEAEVENYTSDIEVVENADGYRYVFTVTNTELTDVTVTKVWADNDNQDGLRTDVQLTLTGSDGESYTGTIHIGESSYTWKFIPVYSESGEKIEYTLTEATIGGYSADIVKGEDGYTFTVTNSHTPATTSVTVTKVWEDDDNQDGLRKDVQLTLSGSDGKTYSGTIHVGESTYTWSDLPVYYNNGTKIEYSLTEATMDGYSAQIVKGADGYSFTITNTHSSTVTKVTVTKVWDDNYNQDGLRADVHLTLTGSDGSTYSGVIKLGETTFTWNDLPVYFNGGQTIVYTLTEAAIEGYTTDIVKGEDGYTFTVTNTLIEKTDVTATKIWVDNNNQDGLRKDVQLTLTGSDGSTYSGTIHVGESSYTWSDLPIYKDGEKIEYSLTEATVDGYSAQIVKGDDGYTFTVTNTHSPATTSVTVTKVWADNDNQDGLQKDVQLTLTGSDGNTYQGTIPVGQTSFTWSDLPVYFDNGTLIEYTLTEAEMDGYTAQITKGDDGYTFTVTNSHTPAVVEIPVKKHWEDRGNELTVRPDNITFVLYGSDGSERMATVRGEGDDWSYTFKGLPKYYNNGTLIEYTLTELPVHGYTTDIQKGEDGYTFTVTNSIVYGRLHITKTAEDGLVEGLRFRIHGVSHQGTTVDMIVVTGPDGVARADYILPGYYYVEEVDVPDRYVTPAQQTVIVIGDDSDPEITMLNFHNTLKRMTITVNKTAEDGILAGHKFRLTGTDYLGNEIDLIGETDENGVLVFDNLLAGDYTVTEIETDVRYVVPDDQDVTVNWGVDESVSFQNILKRMTITVNKTAEDGVLEGHKFRLTGTDYLGNEIDIIGSTDANGVLVFENLLAGDYTVTEIETDVRYVVPDAQDVTVNWGVDESVSFQNILKRMTITVNKTAEDGVLEGHKFRLTGTDYLGNDIDLVGETDENGVVVFENLLAGDYTVTEIETDVRYVVPDDQDVTVTWGVDESVSFENNLKYWCLTVHKTDDSTGEAVPGAVYGVYKNGELLDEYTTDENGSFTTKDYLCGEDYTLKEISPAPGYTLDSAEYALEGTSAEICIEALTALETDVTDTPTHVVITKTDVTTSKPLPGAEITVYDANGNVVYKGITDENGKMEAFYLPVGVYTFKETAAPDGYKLNTTVFTFEIHEDGSVTGDTEIEDESHRVVLDKKDKTSKAPVVGAVIEVYDETGDLVGRYTTDENGKVVIIGIKPGTYTYKEIEAPVGYVLDETLHTFVLHEDGSVTGETTFENASIEPTSPKTGDSSLLLGGAALLSLLGGFLFIGRRRRKEDTD